MKYPLTSYVKWSICGFLAMTCVSCAHQQKDTALMIDTDAPNEEHVWSESREVKETIAAEPSREEQELAELDKNEPQATQESESVAKVDSDEQANAEVETSDNREVEKQTSEETSKLDTSASDSVAEPKPLNETTNVVMASNEIAKVDEGKSPTEGVQTDSDTNLSDVKREVSSDAPMEEITPPSQVEPTIGVPAKLKTDDKVPSKKPSTRTKTWPGGDKASVQKNNLTSPRARLVKEPEVAIVSPEELNFKSKSKSNDQMNELGEENDSTPQLASVEIAHFIQNHWLAVLFCSIGFMLILFFYLRRKGGDDPQAI